MSNMIIKILATCLITFISIMNIKRDPLVAVYYTIAGLLISYVIWL